MSEKHYLLIIFIAIIFFNNSNCKETEFKNPRKSLQALLNQCLDRSDIFKCFKVEALKVAIRAARIKSLTITDGLTIMANEQLKVIGNSGLNLNRSKLEKLSEDELDYLLADTTQRFLDTHRVDINIPKIIELTGNSIEARKKGSKMHYGALFAALAIKASLLAMAYKAIGVMSGTAIILGKMALLLAAILGLKKLLSEHQEKTTVEIIKSPKHVEEHVHSTKYEDDYYDHRRRDLDHSMAVQRRVYRFHVPEE